MDFFEVQFPFAAGIHYGANLEVVLSRDFRFAPLAFLLLSAPGFCCCISTKSSDLTTARPILAARDIKQVGPACYVRS
jgi:hypothetical protein